jgi:hypothetical protein
VGRRRADFYGYVLDRCIDMCCLEARKPKCWCVAASVPEDLRCLCTFSITSIRAFMCVAPCTAISPSAVLEPSPQLLDVNIAREHRATCNDTVLAQFWRGFGGELVSFGWGAMPRLSETV